MPPLQSTLRTADGLDLAAEHHLRPACRGVVAFVHGYAEHTGRYGGLLAALAAAGYATHLLDLRGHGRSGGVRGHVLRFEEYLEDLDLFVERIGQVQDQAQPAGARPPRILLGHSLGGLIALRYVLHRSAGPAAFDALAVVSPFLQPTMEVPWVKVGLAAVAAQLSPTLLIKSDIEASWLSHDPAVVAAYEADPLVFKTLNPRWFFEARRAQQEVLERAGEIRLPALFLLGGADPIADPATGRRVFERLGSTDKHLEVYPGLLHEILNEVERQQVLRDLIAWLDTHTAHDPGS
jgi:alpha-beta hydrolase superfamily lysophospholipase